MYAVLIPSLKPNDKLINLIKEIKKHNIENIFVINDGSPKEYEEYFNKCKKLGCIILKHNENKGKGRAIKTVIKEIKDNYKDIKGVVTADSDGQHSAKDISKVMDLLKEEDKLILGTRNLKEKHVPLASKIGNLFSSLYFKLTTGIYLKDTQTGLRGIPRRYFDYSLNIEGERFEYEMNYLEKIKENNIEFKTIDIDTIYEKDRTTHFRFFKDSIKIYKKLVRNLIVSISSGAIDISLFYIIRLFGITSFLSSIIARIISGIYNFILNKVWTFEKKDSNESIKELVKYTVLFIVQMLVSSSLTEIIDNTLKLKAGIILAKIIIDLIIFFINYIIMKRWIFRG